MKVPLGILLLVFALAAPLTAIAYTPTTSTAYALPHKPISLEIQNAGVRQVLESILSAAEMKYEIDPRITNKITVSLFARQVAWSEVFKNITGQAKLQYGFDEQGRVLVTKP